MIVLFVAINMMNHFILSQKAAKFVFHHKAMFSNVVVAVLVWMIMAQYKDIAIFIDHAATLPPSVTRPYSALVFIGYVMIP